MFSHTHFYNAHLMPVKRHLPRLGQTMQHQLQAADAGNPPGHSLQHSEACLTRSDCFAHVEHQWLPAL